MSIKSNLGETGKRIEHVLIPGKKLILHMI